MIIPLWIEKNAAEKKELKAKEKKQAEKKAREERLEKAKEKKTEKEYVTIETDSMDELLSKVQGYSYENASHRVMTDSERMLGGHVDFKG